MYFMLGYIILPYPTEYHLFQYRTYHFTESHRIQDLSFYKIPQNRIYFSTWPIILSNRHRTSSISCQDISFYQIPQNIIYFVSGHILSNPNRISSISIHDRSLHQTLQNIILFSTAPINLPNPTEYHLFKKKDLYKFHMLQYVPVPSVSPQTFYVARELINISGFIICFQKYSYKNWQEIICFSMYVDRFWPLENAYFQCVPPSIRVAGTTYKAHIPWICPRTFKLNTCQNSYLKHACLSCWHE